MHIMIYHEYIFYYEKKNFNKILTMQLLIFPLKYFQNNKIYIVSTNNFQGLNSKLIKIVLIVHIFKIFNRLNSII